MLEEEILIMSKIEKLGRINELNNEIALITKHLNDTVYRHRSDLTYDQNVVVDTLIAKQNSRGPAVYTGKQIASMLYGRPDGYIEETLRDLEFLVTKKVLNKKLLYRETFGYALCLK